MSATPPALAPGTPVLVTGATGFTGVVLTRKLVAAGLRVTAIARASSNRESLRDLDIRWVFGDVFDPAVVAEAARDAAYIFHMATAYRVSKTRADYFHKVHVVSTQLLAECARRNPNFQRFVHVSTCGVHGHVAGAAANEEHPFAPGDAYQATKAEAELWIRDYSRREGLPITVIRPAAIYGPGDRRLLKLFRMTARGVVPILGSGRAYLQLVHVDDLCNVLIRAATHPAALNEVFLCADLEPTTIPQIVRIIAQALDRRVHLIRLPAWPFFVAAALCEAVCYPFGWAPPLFRRRVAFFVKDRLFDTRKLRDRLDWQMHYTAATGLAETARWYRAQGWL